MQDQTLQAVEMVSKFKENTAKERRNAIRRVFRYIKGTSSVALCFEGTKLVVKGYVDPNFVGDPDKRKFTIGYAFTLARRAVSWLSKLQNLVVLSITKAKCIPATQASKETILIQRLMGELRHKQQKLIVYCES